MAVPLLTVSDLRVHLDTGGPPARVVDGVSFAISAGETFVLLGESGCGKSMTALALLRLLPPGGRYVSGSISLNGTDLLRIPEQAMREVRGRRVAMVFQEPQTALNPVLTVGVQVGEVLTRHRGLRGAARRDRVVELLNGVGIADPQRRAEEYPHQLSGGMKQRVMIAMALAGEPDLLVADEPTTALDVTMQAQVLQLLREIKQRTGMAILLITHDLGVVAEMADRIGVMYAGQIVEEAGRIGFIDAPLHPYSRKLFESLPDDGRRGAPLAVIEGVVPPLSTEFRGCRFESRCERRWETCALVPPKWIDLGAGRYVRCHLHDIAVHDVPEGAARAGPAQPVAGLPWRGSEVAATLTVRDLKVHFPIERGIFRRTVGHVYAVDGLTLTVPPASTLALVGESGCGKTTAGKAIARLLDATGGEVRFDGTDVLALRGNGLRRLRREIQFIFQDPYASMNPRMSVADIVAEGMVSQGIGRTAAERLQRVDSLLMQVGLDPEARSRYPHEFSGGQRQRICIARALAVQPRLVICDEPTSALDVSVQAQILNLLQSLQRELGLSYLFITHNLAVVRYLAHEVAVMYLGRIVEHGPIGAVMAQPRHPYTRALLSAAPQVDPETRRERIRLEGELPSPSAPPAGCHFHPRCPVAVPRCREQYPAAVSVGPGHMARCHLLAAP
ncbi:MAG: dipeptide ABC transporter ATP-binding protein [Gammaproteobacteria bacterium]|nr:dipeptide ABC transporter ATP-binding protein [Gammaproteobacteria bacterium]MCG3143986.1 putative ABC transporter ATP-binding protein [Gammaproteobacteria bacterium]